MRLRRFLSLSCLSTGLLKGRRLPLCLGALSTLLVLWLYTTGQPTVSNLLTRLDHLVYDQRYALMLEPPAPREHRIVIVDYDQYSLEREGQWPWSRFTLGDLLRQLTDHGALVIGFDVYFPEYERNLVSELSERAGEELGQQGLLDELQAMAQVLDGDRYFARQMAGNDVVLGFSFRPESSVRSGVLPQPLFRIDQQLAGQLSVADMQGYVGNIDILQNAAMGAGFFDVRPDSDGIIRRAPLVLQFENRFYPSLPLEMARLYLFEERFGLETAADSLGTYLEVSGIRMGNIRIPTDAQGQVLVPYAGLSQMGSAGTFPYISATDVLRGNLQPDEVAALQNSLVLLGTTATGLFDLRTTPLEAVYPGVEVHANILDAILRSATSMTVQGSEAVDQAGILESLRAENPSPFPYRPDWERGAMLVLLSALGLLLSLVYPRLGALGLALCSLILMGGITLANFQLWQKANLDLPLVIILLLILLITLVNMTCGFLREGLSRRAIKDMFDQYVPPAHIDAMLAHPDRYNFAGESRDMSVLFSDIHGFTSISEQLDAAQLKSMLNDFFTPVTGIIFEHQGTIDKYVGDMVMAFWGAPLEDPDHRVHAVDAALAILEKVEQLQPAFRARGLPGLNIGIGINSGQMNVGDMGSTYRRAYTVLGDAVNLASRLEALTRFYGVGLLVGEDTAGEHSHKALEDFLCRRIDQVQVKGKQQPVSIYQPLCRRQEASAQLVRLVEDYHWAFDAYLRQHWEEAEGRFQALQQEDPETTLYGIYLDRISSLKSDKIAPDWDGTWRHTSK